MNNIVESKRSIYTPSKFAKESLIYLQEVGTSKTYGQHTNSRKYMNSFLFFIVKEGDGSLKYNTNTYDLKQGDCVFIDCHKPYSHSSNNWEISWVHINGNNLKNIYYKYLERDGNIIFNAIEPNKYINLLDDVYMISTSNDYTRDMNIYSKITDLLSLLMSETIYPEKKKSKHIYDLDNIKKYLDDNYTKNISLDEISSIFFINKFYLTRAFKNKYGLTIYNYVIEKRITKAKELLRFSNKKIEDISSICGFNDPNYFSRTFKKVENMTPIEYKKTW